MDFRSAPQERTEPHAGAPSSDHARRSPFCSFWPLRRPLRRQLAPAGTTGAAAPSDHARRSPFCSFWTLRRTLGESPAANVKIFVILPNDRCQNHQTADWCNRSLPPISRATSSGISVPPLQKCPTMVKCVRNCPACSSWISSRLNLTKAASSHLRAQQIAPSTKIAPQSHQILSWPSLQTDKWHVHEQSLGKLPNANYVHRKLFTKNAISHRQLLKKIHISVWGSSFVGCHPARIRPSTPLHSTPLHSLDSLTRLTHCGSLRRLHKRLARLVAAGGPALSAVAGACPLGARLSPQCPETADGAAARMVAAGGLALSAVSGAGVQRLQKDLRRAWSPLGARLSPQCLWLPLLYLLLAAAVCCLLLLVLLRGAVGKIKPAYLCLEPEQGISIIRTLHALQLPQCQVSTGKTVPGTQCVEEIAGVWSKQTWVVNLPPALHTSGWKLV